MLWLKENFLHDICFQCLHKMSRSERSNQKFSFLHKPMYFSHTLFRDVCKNITRKTCNTNAREIIFHKLFFLGKNNAIPDASPNFMFVSLKNAIGWKTWLGIFMRGQKSPRANDARPPISMKWQDCRTLKYKNPSQINMVTGYWNLWGDILLRLQMRVLTKRWVNTNAKIIEFWYPFTYVP